MKTLLFSFALLQAITFPPGKNPGDYYPLRLYVLKMEHVTSGGVPKVHGFGNVIEDGGKMHGVEFDFVGGCPTADVGPNGRDLPLVARWGGSRTDLRFLVGNKALGHTAECDLTVKVDELNRFDLDAQGNIKRSRAVPPK